VDASTHLAIERARAEKKSPVVLWLVNIIWPGLGNMVVGQTGLGILFGLLQWFCVAVAFITLGFGSVVLLVNWAVASAVGHSRINTAYSKTLARIEGSLARMQENQSPRR
jgi:TM2 domain-containing membrane protein YozV